MKKIKTLFLVFGLTTSIYAGDINSCINMSEKEFPNFIKQFQKSINLSHFKTDEINDMDRHHINSTLSNSIDIKKCMYLRNIREYDENDDRRYRSLMKLQNLTLTDTEKGMYEKALKKSKVAFQEKSGASLIDRKSCNSPLIYVTAQNSEKGGTIIYEYRLINGKLTPSQKRVLSKNVKPSCSDTLSMNKYLNYLNREKNQTFTIFSKNKNTFKAQDKQIYNFNTSRKYKVISKVKVKSFKDNEIHTFLEIGFIVDVDKIYKKNNIIFFYGDEKFIVSKQTWMNNMEAF